MQGLPMAQDVTEFPGRKPKGKDLSDRDGNWLRRQALLIVAQLPECRTDALVVLDLSKEIVQEFFKKPA
jgi:hypothetical protein